MTRPVLARTSSAASGLRFCGIIEEPVVNLSDSLTRPVSGEDQITISSASRDRCTAAIEAAASVSIDEVAVGHGVERIRRRPVEAERLRRHVAVEIGNEVPASAPEPSGDSLSRLRASAKRPRSRAAIST